MQIHFTTEQQALIRGALKDGRLLSEQDAIAQAMALWEERERIRAEILAAVDAAEASLAQGKGRIITAESMQQLADEIKQRGRNRLAAGRPADT